VGSVSPGVALTLGFLDRIGRCIVCTHLRDPFLPGVVRNIGTVKDAGDVVHRLGAGPPGRLRPARRQRQPCRIGARVPGVCAAMARRQ